MATVTIYLLNTTATAPNWFGRVQDGGSAPAGALSAFGWTVAKTALTTPYWRGYIGATARNSTAAGAASYIDGSLKPQSGTGSGQTTAGDSFRSDNPLNGTFAAGNWNFTFGMRTGAASNSGRIRCNMWASVNADGTGARKLNSATLVGTAVTMNSATTTFNSTVTWAAPSVVLANEYLFLQPEWQSTVVGTSNSCTAQFYQASFVTTNYVYAPATATLALTQAAQTLAATGTVVGPVVGNLVETQDDQTLAATAYIVLPVTGALTQTQGGVELLLHLDGADGATTIPDDGGSNRIVSVHGTAQIDTGQSVFAGQSLMLPAAGAYLSVGGDIAFGTNDFCVDLRARMSPAAEQVFYDGGDNGFKISYDGAALMFESAAGTITGSALADDTDYHIAATRAAGSTRLWRDGVQQGSTLADATDYGGTAGYPRVGSSAAPPAANFVATAFPTVLTSAFADAVFTFSGCNIGTPSADRVVVVGASASSFRTTLGVTLDGNAMIYAIATSPTAKDMGIWYLPWPTGITASIAITIDVAGDFGGVIVGAMYGVAATPVATQGYAEPTGWDPHTFPSPVTVPANGVAVVFAKMHPDASLPQAWDSPLVDDGTDPGGAWRAASGNFICMAHTLTPGSLQPSISSASPANDFGYGGNQLAMAVWGP